MPPPRLIGRWAMTALVVNTILGSGIFGVPSELIKLLGAASPFAMILAAGAMAIIMLPVAEVSSQFSEPGGMYLYSRTAFGRLVGLQIGWFWFLAITGGAAAGVNVLLSHLGTFFPAVTHGWPRAIAVLCLVAIPTAVNYLGVRNGVWLSFLLTVAKLSPIAIVVLLALVHSSRSPVVAVSASTSAFNAKAWLAALLVLTFSYSGYEDALVPTGEVEKPRLTIPFGLIAGFLICCCVYTSLQWAIVATVGVSATDHPLVDTASVLLGSRGASFVAILIMISTYGWISGAFFNAPRFAVSLAAKGDCPRACGNLHPRHQTPSLGILSFALAVTMLSLTGTFLWAIALTAGSAMVIYAATCAALIRLRQTQSNVPAMRVPFGVPVAAAGIVICMTLLSQVDWRHLALMSVTSLFAIGNWLWAKSSASNKALAARL